MQEVLQAAVPDDPSAVIGLDLDVAARRVLNRPDRRGEEYSEMVDDAVDDLLRPDLVGEQIVVAAGIEEGTGQACLDTVSGVHSELKRAAIDGTELTKVRAVSYHDKPELNRSHL